VAKQVTETTPFLHPFDLEALENQILSNHIAFSKARTADDMYRLNRELEPLVRQLEEAAA